MSALATLVSRAGRHAAVYAVGFMLTAAASIVALAVYTRFMPPSDFGKLAILLVLSGLLTLLYTVGTVQGTLGVVFRQTDDEGGGDDDLVDVGGAEEPVAGKREALGTGLILVTLIVCVGTAVMWVLAPSLAELLLDGSEQALEVRLAAVLGALAGAYRVVIAVPRFERRPKVFVALNVGRPLLSIAAATPLLASAGSGDGPWAVLTGMTATSAVCLLVALLVIRRSFIPRFEPSVVSSIVRLGAVFVPLGFSLWIIAQSGVLLLAGSVSSAEIGFLRVAVTFGAILLQCAAAFFAAWIPLKRTSAAVAAHKERGQGAIGSALTTWFSIGCLSVFMLLVAGADIVVKIARPDYAPAAALLPLVAGAALAHAVFLLTFRIAAFPRKRLALAIVTPLAAAVFVGAVFLLVPVLGVRAVPVAGIVAFAGASLAIVVCCQRGPKPIPFEYGRLARLAALTGATIAGHSLLDGRAGDFLLAVDAGLLAAFFAGLVVLRIVPAGQARALGRIAREALRPPGRRRADLADRLVALPPRDVATLARVLGPGRQRDAGGELPAPAEVVGALRALGEAGEPGAEDAAIGRYLLSGLSRAERDAMARALWRRRVDPGELDRLEQAVEAVRRIPARTWRAAEARAEAGQASAR